MFDKLKSAFSSVSKSLGEMELMEKDVEKVLSELQTALLQSDVAMEVVDSINAEIKSGLAGTRVDKKTADTFVRDSLIRAISLLFDGAGTVDLFDTINKCREKNAPCIVMFVGINGTGKTTSLAKVASLLQKSKYSVAVAAADTFRAGAIEQLREHTNRLNIKIIAQNYGSDPAAVARDAVLYAKSHKVDCVLIDTAGRMQTSKNLMEQIAKITKVVRPTLKIFVGDSLAGNDTVNQAKEFYEHTKFDGSILTKADADARGGAALSIVRVTSTPVMFVGVGQEYDDLKPFDKHVFLKEVFGSLDGINLEQESDGPRPSLQQQGHPVTKPQPETPQLPQPQQPTGKPQPETPQPPQPQQPRRQPTPKPEEKPQPETPPPSQQPRQPQQQPPPKPAADGHKPVDPFEGISEDDIAAYADLYDMPPPESDEDAQRAARRIKGWIGDGRPRPVRESGDNDTDPTADQDAYDDRADATNTAAAGRDADGEKEKPKKKRGLFGFLKK